MPLRHLISLKMTALSGLYLIFGFSEVQIYLVQWTGTPRGTPCSPPPLSGGCTGLWSPVVQTSLPHGDHLTGGERGMEQGQTGMEQRQREWN